jgi:hypothetical protein
MRKSVAISIAYIAMSVMPAVGFDFSDPFGIKEEIEETIEETVGVDIPSVPQPNISDPTNIQIPLPDPNAIKECIRAPGNCPEQLTQEAIYHAVWPVVEQYKASLRAQASWQGLPDWFARAAQRHYPIDLGAIRYATNVNTLHGAAITFGNEIFFPRDIDLTQRDDIWWMLHEIQHSAQYASLGENAFLGSYVLDSAQTIIETGSVNVHDALDHEQNANAVADGALDIVVADIGGGGPQPNPTPVPMPQPQMAGPLLVVSNACWEPIEIAVAYVAPDNQWYVDGYYSFAPGEEDSLEGYNGVDIRLGQPGVLFHAYSQNIRWQGPTIVPVNGQPVPMMPANLFQRGSDAVLSVNC